MKFMRILLMILIMNQALLSSLVSAQDLMKTGTVDEIFDSVEKTDVGSDAESVEKNVIGFSPDQRVISGINVPPGQGDVTITKDNFLDFFLVSGDATYNKTTGVLRLTRNIGGENGNATFNRKVSFDSDILLDMDLNIGNKSSLNGGADGITTGFHEGEVTAVGENGGHGIRKLPSVIGFKIDTYAYNQDDPPRFQGNTYGGLIINNTNQDRITVLDNANRYGTLSLPKQVQNPIRNEFENQLFAYNKDTNKINIAYEDKTFELDLKTLDPYLYDPTNPTLKSLIIYGSTGGAYNLHEVRINEMKLTVPVAVLEKVDKDDPTIKLQGAVFDIYNSSDVRVAENLTTDSAGYAYLPNNLVSGDYYAKEVNAPAGYTLITENIPFKIDNNMTQNYIAETITNTRLAGEITTEKTVDQAVVNRHDVIQYTIKVTNTGAPLSVLRDVLVRDVLPSGLLLNADTVTVDGRPVSNETTEDNTVLVTIDELSEGESVDVSFAVTVTQEPAQTITNVALVSAGNLPNDPPKQPDVDVKVVYFKGELETSKNVYDENGDLMNDRVVGVNDVLTYEISTKNVGIKDSLVSDIRITDEIPAGLLYEPGTLAVKKSDGTTQTLSDDAVVGQVVDVLQLGDLLSEESLTLSFKVKVTEKATGTLNNVAAVKALTPSDTPGQPDVSLTERPSVSVGIPGEVEATKRAQSAVSGKVYPGDEITYEIELTHVDRTGEWNGTIQDTLPQHLAYVEGSTTLNGTVLRDRDVWKDDALTVRDVTVNQVEKSALVAFKVKVLNEAVNTTLTNVAYAKPTITDPLDPFNPLEPIIPGVDVSVLPKRGQLEATKDVLNVAGDSVHDQVVKVEDTLTYEITAKNVLGAETIVNHVVVTDDIPAGLVYQPGSLTVTYPDGTKKQLADDQVNGQVLVTEDLGAITGGQQLIVSFDVTVTEKATGTLTNVATVSGTVPPSIPGEPDEATDAGNKEVPIGVPGQVNGVKLVDEGTSSQAYVGENITYSIKLTHVEGTGEWTGEMTDPLPEGVRYVRGSTVYNGVSLKDDDVWTDDVLTVPNVTVNQVNKEVVVSFDVTVLPSFIDTVIENKAYATPLVTDPLDPFNPLEPNIPGVETAVVKSAGTLASKKVVRNQDLFDVSGDVVKVGERLSYAISAENISGKDTVINNVVIRDEIPSGLTFVSGSLRLTLQDGKTRPLSDAYVKDQVLQTENLGRLIGGEKVVVTFDVLVTEQASGAITNTATVNATLPPKNSSDKEEIKAVNTPETTFGVPGAVRGEKRVNGLLENEAYVGDVLTYTIQLTHQEGAGQWRGSIEDKLPEHVKYVTGSTIFNGEKLEDQEVWVDDQLTIKDVTVNQRNQTALLTFEVVVLEDANGSVVENKAYVKPEINDINGSFNAVETDIKSVKSNISKRELILPQTGTEDDLMILLFGVAVIMLGMTKKTRKKDDV